MQSVVITIPCYNEADRLDLGEFTRLAQGRPGLRLVFVDDGSSDRTREILEEFAGRHSEKIELVVLPKNVGKAEAVRAGLLHSVAGDADVVAENVDAIGYIDADLATPVDEVLRLVDELSRNSAGAVFGARVACLGANVRRSPSRHYLGRVFATMASIALSESVYDTQCGAKFFRNSEEMRACIEEPFLSRWAFDVELLGRLLAKNISIIEVPLKEWQDVTGSKIRVSSMLQAGVDLVKIGVRLRRRR